MNCCNARRLLPLLVDGGLNRGAQDRLQAHVNDCQSCRDELRRLRETDDLLRSLAECTPPPGFPGQLALRLEKERSRPSRRWLGGVANIVLAIGGGIGLALTLASLTVLVDDGEDLGTILSMIYAGDWPAFFDFESVLADPWAVLGSLHSGAAEASDFFGGTFLLGATIVLVVACAALLQILIAFRPNQDGLRGQPLHR